MVLKMPDFPLTLEVLNDACKKCGEISIACNEEVLMTVGEECVSMHVAAKCRHLDKCRRLLKVIQKGEETNEALRS